MVTKIVLRLERTTKQKDNGTISIAIKRMLLFAKKVVCLENLLAFLFVYYGLIL